MKIYGSEPIEIASDFIVDNSEMYFYQYLPIHLQGSTTFAIPERLNRLKDLVDVCCYDFGKNIDDNLNGYYIYLTAKCLYVKGGENLNRSGWHCDGFMTDDINYIWCDCIPTIYTTGKFDLVQDHELSIKQMEDMLKYRSGYFCKPNSIYRLDETVIHKCDYNREKHAVLRHFVKVSFSKEKYNLKGNSHNYLLDYDWEMKERDAHRNHPIK